MSDNQFKKPDAYKSINHSSSVIPTNINVTNITPTPITTNTNTSWWNSIGGDKLDELMMTCDK